MEFPMRKPQELSNSEHVNEDSVEDSEFLSQASLFLQTAEQQLNSIQSSLQHTKFSKKIFNLNLENCGKKEYAKELVKAVLNGYNVDQEESLSAPRCSQKTSRIKNTESAPIITEQPAIKHHVEKNAFKEEKRVNSSLNSVSSVGESDILSERLQQQKFFSSLKNRGKFFDSREGDTARYVCSQNLNTQTVIKNPFVDNQSQGAKSHRMVRNKINMVETIHAPKYKKKAQTRVSKNAALINVTSNLASSTDEDKEGRLALRKENKCLTIQMLPSINIKPELTQETFTQVHILPSSNSGRKIAANKNVTFLEIVQDDDSEKISRRPGKCAKCSGKSGTEERKYALNPLKVLQVLEPSHGGSRKTEDTCNARRNDRLMKGSLRVRKQEHVFNREKLHSIISSISETLALHVEIPDEILERTIDRLWALGDYLEDVYTNSEEGYRQKVRLNFTSLWLHEIIRLIDNEMRTERGSINLSSGINTIVLYLISEIHCASDLTEQRPCILAEEDGEIRFYCCHDSLSNQIRKPQTENGNSNVFDATRRNRIFAHGSNHFKLNEFENSSIRTFTRSSFGKPPLKFEKLEPNSVSKFLLVKGKDNNESSSCSPKTIVDGEKNNRESSKSSVSFNFSPEKLASSKARKHSTIKVEQKPQKFNSGSNFIDANQRQKVIQKLNEEVQKMLDFHAKLKLNTSFDDKHKAKIKSQDEGITSLAKAPSSISSPSKSKVELSAAEQRELKNTKVVSVKTNVPEAAEAQVSSSSIHAAPVDKSIPCSLVKVSASNSSEDVVYDDDWEDDINTSQRNKDDKQSISNERSNGPNSKASSQDDSVFHQGEKGAEPDPLSVGRNKADKTTGRSSVKKTSSSDEKLINSAKTSTSSLIRQTPSEIPEGGSNETGTKVSSKVPSEKFTKSETNSPPPVERMLSQDLNGRSTESEKSVLKKQLNSLPKTSTESIHSIAKSTNKSSSKASRPGVKPKTDFNSGSETDAISDFSSDLIEGKSDKSTISTPSDSSDTSNPDLKKSSVISEAETVKDLSWLSSEAVHSDPKATLSLHIYENSFKDNDANIFAEDYLHLLKEDLKSAPKNPKLLPAKSKINGATIQDSLQHMSIFKNLRNPEERPLSKTSSSSRGEFSHEENFHASLKLSKSCDTLAKQVIQIEQMKNFLFEGLKKSDSKPFSKILHKQITPDKTEQRKTFKNHSKFEKKLQTSVLSDSNDSDPKECKELEVNANNFTKNQKENVTNKTFEKLKPCETSDEQLGKVECSTDKLSSDNRVLLSDRDVPNGLKDSPPEAKLSVHKQLVFAESSSKSCNYLLSASIETKLPAKVDSTESKTPSPQVESNCSQFCQLIEAPTGLREREVIEKCSVENSSLLQKKDNNNRKSNKAVKSFAELSKEILNSLKHEAELLARLESSSIARKTTCESKKSLVDFEGGDSFDKSEGSLTRIQNNGFDLGFNVTDVPELSSDASFPVIESLMSELSENILASTDDDSDNLPLESIDEIFSWVSSESFEVESSKSFEELESNRSHEVSSKKNNFISNINI